MQSPLNPTVKAKPTPAQVEEEGAAFMALMATPMQGKAGA